MHRRNESHVPRSVVKGKVGQIGANGVDDAIVGFASGLVVPRANWRTRGGKCWVGYLDVEDGGDEEVDRTPREFGGVGIQELRANVGRYD